MPWKSRSEECWWVCFQAHSREGWRRERPSEVNWSNHTAQAGSHISSCSEPCPEGFWVPPRKEIPQVLSGPVPVLGHPHRQKVFPDSGSVSGGTSCVSVSAHHLMSCHWAPPKIPWFCPLCTLPSCVYILEDQMFKCLKIFNMCVFTHIYSCLEKPRLFLFVCFVWAY